MRIAPKQTLTPIIPIILIPDWSQTNSPLNYSSEPVLTWSNCLNLSEYTIQETWKRELSFPSPSLIYWPHGVLTQWHNQKVQNEPLIKAFISRLKISILFPGCYTIPLIIVMRIWQYIKSTSFRLVFVQFTSPPPVANYRYYKNLDFG